MATTTAPTTPVTPVSPSPSQVGNPNYAAASLYVGDLKPDVTENLLFEVFNTVGPVASIRVCRDVVTRRSLGYAYVNFHTVQDAERAVDTMNFQPIRGHPCRIMWLQRDPSLRKSGVGNIFVKNLAPSIDHKTLYDTFSIFGNILSCKVATNDKGESLGYGFVHYETLKAAELSIEKVNRMVIADRNVSVAPFLSKTQRDGPENITAFTNVYVKGLAEDMTEEGLKELFSKYGEVTQVCLPTHESGKAKGFGFANFKTNEDAAHAVADLNTPDGPLYVARAQKKKERERLLREKFETLRNQQAQKYHGVNLYIKNLDDSVDDVALEAEFKEFGEITSAKVMRDLNGRSRGFGFVCFTNKEEAAKAVSDMMHKVLCGKPLYVALAQPKEVRRQQLEAAQVGAQARSKMANGGLPHPHPMFASPASVFYQQQPHGHPSPHLHPQGFMHPQQMVQQRWGPRQGQSPQYMAVPGPRGPQGQPMGPNMYMNNVMPQYQQQHMQQGRGAGMPQGPGGGRGGGRGGVQGGRQSVMKPTGNVPRQQQAGPAGGQPMPGQQNRIKYENNVRNQQGGPQAGQPQQPQQPAANGVQAVVAPVDGATPTGPPGPLTSQGLARAPPQQQKQMIGERIFPLIQERKPKLAGKITGMLLEMDNTELLHLLDNREALEVKIGEAMNVLAQHDDTAAAQVAQEKAAAAAAQPTAPQTAPATQAAPAAGAATE